MLITHMREAKVALYCTTTVEVNYKDFQLSQSLEIDFGTIPLAADRALSLKQSIVGAMVNR
jgi:hypothetical protein